MRDWVCTEGGAVDATGTLECEHDRRCGCRRAVTRGWNGGCFSSGRMPRKPGRPKKRQSVETYVILTRPILVRFSKLHDLWREQLLDPNPARRFHSYAGLAKLMECSKSTIRRDIATLRDQYKLPIDEFKDRGGWGYTRDVEALPNVLMTEGDLVALCASWGAMAARRGKPLNLQGRPALEKLMSAYGYKLPFTLQDVSERIVFRASGYHEHIDVEIFETVVWAVMNQHELEFVYCKTSSNLRPAVPEHRRVQPRCLVCFDHVYYLVSNDPSRNGEIRTFALFRMQSAKDTEKNFTPVGPFDLDIVLRDSLGVHTGGEIGHVELLFKPCVAGLVREHSWHPSEAFEIAEDGRLRLTMDVAMNPELEQRIWKWGPKVEVINPPELRTKFEEAVKELTGVYLSANQAVGF
jgi:predicted DNA-binding transcriptional regulator YafY